MNNGSESTYYQAKITADEFLHNIALNSESMTGISLRPGVLTEAAAGGVELGKTSGVQGTASRKTVAQVISALLAAPDVQSGWIDLLDGNEDIDRAVQKVVEDRVDTAEGESC